MPEPKAAVLLTPKQINIIRGALASVMTDVDAVSKLAGPGMSAMSRDVADTLNAVATLHEQHGLATLLPPTAVKYGLETLTGLQRELGLALHDLREYYQAINEARATIFTDMRKRAVCPICQDYSGNCEHRDMSLVEFARAYDDRPVSAQGVAA